jgi:SAM-dependent methyltransferase
MSQKNRSNDRAATRRGLVNWVADKLSVFRTKIHFPGSAAYWDGRYKSLGSSGAGSYGDEAMTKATYINQFIEKNSVQSVVDFGCGDGAQLTLLNVPKYLGIDVSPEAIKLCRNRFASDDGKAFLTLADYSGEIADATFSLDVIYHLVEDDVFKNYIDTLFNAAERFVLVYSTNSNGAWPCRSAHVRHRELSRYCENRHRNFSLVEEFPASADVPLDRPRFLLFQRC